MRLKNSFYNHFSALSSLFVLFLILWFFYEGLNLPKEVLTVFIIGFIADAIPAVFLHLEYYYYNRGEVFEIDTHSITKLTTRREQFFSTDDIEKIVIYKSANMDAWGFPILAIEYYYYARIITQSGEELIITRLLTPQVEKAVRQLKGVPIERVKRGFCAIFWKRLGNPDI